MTHVSYQKTEFVDRESWLREMERIIGECGQGHFLRNIYGIGGIGKTSLLKHWDEILSYALYIDCSEYNNLISRVGVFGLGIQKQGLDTPRFKLLWSMRTRVLEGLQPAKSGSSDWVFDLVSLIPINILAVSAPIAKRIKSVWHGMKEVYSTRWGATGEWFRDLLGPDWGEVIIHTIRKYPKETISYLLRALIADINARPDPTHNPIVILFDQVESMEQPDRELLVMKRPAPEIVLWHSFASDLLGAIAVTSGRKRIEDSWCSEIGIDQKELQELDESSVIELLRSRRIYDPDLTKAISQIGHGHPFLIQLICDGIEQSVLKLADLTKLQSTELKDVRLKVWRVIFSRAHQVYPLVELASLFSFFNEELLTMLLPGTTSDAWQKFREMSFVKQYDKSKLGVHTLARELAKAEMGKRYEGIIDSAVRTLDEVFRTSDSQYFLAKKLSLVALIDEHEATHHVHAFCQVEHDHRDYLRSLDFISELEMPSVLSTAEVNTKKGQALLGLHRIGEAISVLTSSIEVLEQQFDSLEKLQILSLVSALNDLGVAFAWSDNTNEADECLKRAIEILKQHPVIDDRERRIMISYLNLGSIYIEMWRIHEAKEILEEVLAYFSSKVDELDSYELEVLSHIHRDLGTVYTYLGQNELAGECYHKAQSILEDLENDAYDVEIASILMNRANLLKTAGKSTDAEELYLKALERINGKNYPVTEVMILRNLGILYHNSQRLDEAEVVLLRAKDTLESNPDGKSTSDYYLVQISLGNVWFKRNMIDQAKELVERGVNGLRTLIDDGADALLPDFAGHLMNLGMIYRAEGSFDLAEDCLRKSIGVYEQLIEREQGIFCREYAMIRNNLGLIEMDRRDYSAAEESFLVSMAIYSRLNNVPGVDMSEDIARIRENLGDLYSLMGISREQVDVRVSNKIKDIPPGC